MQVQTRDGRRLSGFFIRPDQTPADPARHRRKRHIGRAGAGKVDPHQPAKPDAGEPAQRPDRPTVARLFRLPPHRPTHPELVFKYKIT